MWDVKAVLLMNEHGDSHQTTKQKYLGEGYGLQSLDFSFSSLQLLK